MYAQHAKLTSQPAPSTAQSAICAVRNLIIIAFGSIIVLEGGIISGSWASFSCILGSACMEVLLAFWFFWVKKRRLIGKVLCLKT